MGYISSKNVSDNLNDDEKPNWYRLLQASRDVFKMSPENVLADVSMIGCAQLSK